MNDYIKSKIIKNEYALMEEFPEYKQSINQFIKKIETTKYDSILYELVVRSFGSKEKVEQEKKYNEKGYYSSRQLLIKNFEQLDMSEKLSISNLIIGEKYNPIEICSIASNYNNQVGMYYVDENNILIKCTVEDNNRVYNDRWIKKDIILQYCMQRENDINLKTLIFSNKPNATIFNALMEGSLINIHTFINHKKGDVYEYFGVFHPCGLVNNNKSFLLYKEGYDYEIPYDNLEAQFIYALTNDNDLPNNSSILKIEKIFEHPIALEKQGIKKSKRNALQQLKIELEVELRAEDLVLHYEKNKLLKAGYPELAEKVKNVSLYDSSLGYDILSYEVCDGEANEIFIKVKGSINSSTNNFLFTDLELKHLHAGGDDYKFYRVYDIYTDKPKFFDAREDFINAQVVPKAYSVSVRY